MFLSYSALQTEIRSQAPIAALLDSFSPSQAPQTRSQARSNRKRKRSSSPSPHSKLKLNSTPLPSLFLAGLNEEQIWAQLELRAQNVCQTLEQALEGAGEELDNGHDGMGLTTSGDLATFVREDAELGVNNDDDNEVSEDDQDEENETTDGSGEESDGKNIEEGIAPLQDSDSEDGQDESEFDNSAVNSSERVSSSRKRGRGVSRPGGQFDLDDGFFDLATFNAETEEAEAKSVSRGSLARDSDSGDEGDNDSVDIFADIDMQEDAATAEQPGAYQTVSGSS